MRIPNFTVFAQMPYSTRRQWLELICRFPSHHGVPFLRHVHQSDPDDSLREMAQQALAKQGITPPTDLTPINISADGGDSANRQQDIRGVSSTAPHTPYAEMFGHPLQRGPHLANIFTLYRRNSKYLTGERAHLQRISSGNFLMIGSLICASAILWFTFKVKLLEAFAFVPTSALVPVDIAAGVIALGTISLWIWRIRRDRRYEMQGQLFLGKVKAATGKWIGDNESITSFSVCVSYCVQLSNGEIIDRQATNTRNDLFRLGLPNPGDPVAVLAIDRDHVRLL